MGFHRLRTFRNHHRNLLLRSCWVEISYLVMMLLIVGFHFTFFLFWLRLNSPCHGSSIQYFASTSLTLVFCYFWQLLFFQFWGQVSFTFEWTKHLIEIYWSSHRPLSFAICLKIFAARTVSLLGYQFLIFTSQCFADLLLVVLLPNLGHVFLI